jgi:hypothetical protein
VRRGWRGGWGGGSERLRDLDKEHTSPRPSVYREARSVVQ